MNSCALLACRRSARVGVRALQLAFRNQLDRTPLEHRREIRIGRARAELLDADRSAGDTPAATARRRGYPMAARVSGHDDSMPRTPVARSREP